MLQVIGVREARSRGTLSSAATSQSRTGCSNRAVRWWSGAREGTGSAGRPRGAGAANAGGCTTVDLVLPIAGSLDVKSGRLAHWGLLDLMIVDLMIGSQRHRSVTLVALDVIERPWTS
jgi:hypothetical protein